MHVLRPAAAPVAPAGPETAPPVGQHHAHHRGGAGARHVAAPRRLHCLRGRHEALLQAGARRVKVKLLEGLRCERGGGAEVAVGEEVALPRLQGPGRGLQRLPRVGVHRGGHLPRHVARREVAVPAVPAAACGGHRLEAACGLWPPLGACSGERQAGRQRNEPTSHQAGGASAHPPVKHADEGGGGGGAGVHRLHDEGVLVLGLGHAVGDAGGRHHCHACGAGQGAVRHCQQLPESSDAACPDSPPAWAP